MVNFAVWKLLGLIRSHLFIFAFISFAFGEEIQKRNCCDSCQGLSCLFFSNFIVSSLTFRSLIHFIFVYGIREWSNFIILYIAVQFSQHRLLKGLFFFPLYIVASFIIDRLTTSIRVFGDCSFVVQSEDREHDSSRFWYLQMI